MDDMPLNYSAPKFLKTTKHLRRLEELRFERALHDVGERGVEALADATPHDTGETARSWSYKLERTRNGFRLSWSNSVMAGRVPLVLLLQYGHGIKGGGYFYGKDFINPAMDITKQALIEKVVQEVLHG